ncbi:hypothetical protein V2G26_006304 [Clonostachys chloroleuca]
MSISTPRSSRCRAAGRSVPVSNISRVRRRHSVTSRCQVSKDPPSGICRVPGIYRASRGGAFMLYRL